MTELQDILDPNCVRIGVDTHSKKRTIELGSELLADTHIGISARHLFDQLMGRERLGSTGLGEGIAIPHCRSAEVSRIIGALLRLKHPIEFEAPDDLPVDLVFVLVVPKDSDDAHLKVLANLARVFGDQENRKRLRDANTAEALFDVFGAMLQGAGRSSASA